MIFIEIFFNSLVAALPQPYLSESVYFAVMEFGGVNLTVAAMAALSGWLLGVSLLYGFGFLLARMGERLKWKQLQTESFQRSQRTVARYTRWLLLVPAIPFYGFFCVMSGFTGVSFITFLEMAGLGKLLYYGYFIGTMGG